MRRDIIKEGIRYLPARLIPGIVGIIGIPLYTSLLTPEMYGEYLLISNTLILISSLTISWVNSIVIRFNVLLPEKYLNRFTSNLLLICIIASFISWIAFIFFNSNSEDYLWLLLVGFTWLISSSFFEFNATWLRVKNLASRYSYSQIAKSILSVLFAYIIFKIFNKPVALIFGFTMALFISYFAFKNKLVSTVDIYNSVSDSQVVKGLYKYAIPVALTNFTVLAISMSDRYLIDMMLSKFELGIYGANYDLAEKTIFFLNSIFLLSTSVMGYKIFEEHGIAKANIFLSDLLRYYLILASILVVILSVQYRQLLPYILSKEYISNSYIFPLVLTSGLFVGLMHRYSLLLSFYKRTDLILISSIGTLIVNLVACFIFISYWGIEGAAAATLFAAIFWLFSMRLLSKKFSTIKFPWVTLFKIFLISLIIIYFSKHSGSYFPSSLLGKILSATLLGLTYLFFLFIFKVIKTDEFNRMRTIIRNRVIKR